MFSIVVCKALAENGYTAVLGPRHRISSEVIGSVCSNLQIPYFQTHWTPINEKQYPGTFNLYPDANYFSQVNFGISI